LHGPQRYNTLILHPIYALLRDAQQMVLTYQVPIGLSALQVYHSALATMPLCQLWEVNARHRSDIPHLTSVPTAGWDLTGRTIEAGVDVSCMALSPDARSLALGLEEHVQIWDVVTGTHRDITYDPSSLAKVVEFSPDGKRLASGAENGTIRVWDASSGTLQLLADHPGGVPVSCIAFSADHRFIATGAADVRLWDAATGALKHVIQHDGYAASSIRFSPSGSCLVSGYVNSIIRVWDTAIGMQQHLNPRGHGGFVRSVWLLSFDEVTPFTCPNFIVQDWCARGDTSQCTSAHSDSTSLLLFSETSSTAMASTNQVRTTRKNSVVFVPEDLSPKDHVAVRTKFESTARSPWYWTDRHWRRGAGFICVALSPDGKFVASGCPDGTVHLWDATKGMLLRVIGRHAASILSVVFSGHGGAVVAHSDDRIVRVWDTSKDTQHLIPTGHDGPVADLAVSPHGRFIVSGSRDCTMRVWDAVTGTPQFTISGYNHVATSIAYSHDARLIVSGAAEGTVRVWDTDTGVHLHTMLGHEVSVKHVEFSLDDRFILSQDGLDIVRVWDTVTGTQLCVMTDRRPLHTFNREELHNTQEATVEHKEGQDSAATAFVHAYWHKQDTASACPVGQIVCDPIGWVWRVNPTGSRQRICWLPAERRASCVTRRGQTVWIGAVSGAITILDLSRVQQVDTTREPFPRLDPLFGRYVTTKPNGALS
jgi:WD40 repeat protein